MDVGEDPKQENDAEKEKQDHGKVNQNKESDEKERDADGKGENGGGKAEPDTEQEDPLLCHIRQYNLPLVLSRPVDSRGNCWYDSVADQVVINNIANVPRDHLGLRRAVCDAML